VKRALLAAVCVASAACGGAPPPATPAPSTSATTEKVTPAATAASAEAKAPPPPADTTPPQPAVALELVEPGPVPAKPPTVTLRAPTKNQVLPAAKAGDTVVKVDVRDWEVKEGGSHLHVVVDGRPPRCLFDTKKGIKLSELEGATADGAHLLVAFPVTSKHEAAHGAKVVPASVVPYHVGKKGELKWKEGSPLLVLNLPASGAQPPDPEGVLVDFVPLFVELSETRGIVNTVLTGPGLTNARVEPTSRWQAVRVKHAGKGTYTVRLMLQRFEASAVEDGGSSVSVKMVTKMVPQPFGDPSRSFSVASAPLSVLV
jgi:hypothetical protein